jgi:SagB-type dehydrogenase family enzyme
VALPTPGESEAEQLAQFPLLEAFAARRSTRRWDAENPISLGQLGTFLYLSARTKQIVRFEANKPYSYTGLLRCTPSAGSIGELEVYLAVDNCSGLERGLWHYDSHEHSLDRAAGDGALVSALLDSARGAMGGTGRPQVLLIVTARHERIFWKYKGLPYALELKNAGVLFHMWYLVGAALGIGACALGSGDSDLFARATNIPYYQESSIAEFALGSLPID